MVSITKKIANRHTAISSIGRNRWTVGQKKLTPLRKPRNSGGSPSGVSAPPMLLTRKMKKMITWTLCLRSLFARITGRISSIDAPVVPAQLAIIVPPARNAVLLNGEPRKLPAKWMPPATVNSASNRMMNGRYSSSARWRTSNRVNSQPNSSRNGQSTITTQKAETLPKLCSQKCGATSGKTAMESSIPANGTAHSSPSAAPSRCGAPPVWASPWPPPAARATTGSNPTATVVATARTVLFIPFPLTLRLGRGARDRPIVQRTML